jgi:hypothetical protein
MSGKPSINSIEHDFDTCRDVLDSLRRSLEMSKQERYSKILQDEGEVFSVAEQRLADAKNSTISFPHGNPHDEVRKLRQAECQKFEPHLGHISEQSYTIFLKVFGAELENLCFALTAIIPQLKHFAPFFALPDKDLDTNAGRHMIKSFKLIREAMFALEQSSAWVYCEAGSDALTQRGLDVVRAIDHVPTKEAKAGQPLEEMWTNLFHRARFAMLAKAELLELHMKITEANNDAVRALKGKASAQTTVTS